MTKDEALKLSMEAMEITGGFDVEILAIKEALAHPEQEPVVFNTLASLKHKKTIGPIESAMSNATQSQPETWEKFCDSNCVWTDHHPDCKLAQRTWGGLTDDEVNKLVDDEDWYNDSYTFVRAIETKLKEKNT